MADIDVLFNSIIHQESRGKHRDDTGALLTSKAGARGITQLMPGTATNPGYGIDPVKDDSEEEYRRVGRSYFEAMLNQEAGGDVTKALASYNWGAGNVKKAIARHGDKWLAHAPAETQDYVAKITAHAGGQATANAPTPSQVRAGANAARILAIGKAVSNTAADGAAWDAGIKQDVKNDAGFLTSFGAALTDPNVMFEVAAYETLKRSSMDETLDPNWDFQASFNKVQGTLTVEEKEQLFEQGDSGPEGFARAMARIQEDRERSALYENAGALTSLASQFMGGFASPMNYVTGALVGRAYKGVMGAKALAQGPAGKALHFMGENVTGNVAQEAFLDAMGERRTASDYAFAAALGAGFSVPFLPGVVRRAQADATTQALDDLQVAAKERVIPNREQEANRDVDEIKGTVDEGKQPLTLGKIMPDDLDAHIRKEAGDAPAEGTPAVTPKPEAAPKVPTGEATDLDFDSFLALAPDGGAEARAQVAKFVDSFDVDAPDAQAKLIAFMDSATWQGFTAREPLDVTKPLVKTLTDYRKGLALGESDQPRGGDVAFQNSVDPAMRQRTVDAAQGAYTVRQVLDALVKRGETDPKQMRRYMAGADAHALDVHTTAKWMQQQGKDAKWLDEVPVALIARGEGSGGQVHPRAGVAEIFVGRPRTKSAAETPEAYLARMMDDELLARITLHEIMHTRTIHLIAQYSANPKSVPSNIRSSLAAMDLLRARLHQKIAKEQPERYGKEMAPGAHRTQANYAAMNLDEFYAQITSSYGQETRAMLAEMEPSPGFAGRFSNALQELWQHVKTVLGLPHGAPRDTALGEALFHLERTMMYDQRTVDENGVAIFEAWPANQPVSAQMPTLQAAQAQGMSPQGAIEAQQSFAAKMYDAAREWVKANPIDMARLDTLVSKFGALVSDGVSLARSKNPILQQMAGLVAEVSTGAAGRRPTVAIRSHYLEEQLVGLGLRRYDAAYSQWKRSKSVNTVAGWWNDASAGDLRQQFDREVYTEVMNRLNSRFEGREKIETQDVNVLEAAAALEGGFKRALDAQKQANTIGSANMPDDSVGYLPRALNGRVLHSDPEALPLLRDALAKHWTTALGWEKPFADSFANFYIERSRTRALGNRNIDLTGASVDGTSVIRETLEEMAGGATSPEARDAANQALLALNKNAGAAQTKSRLDIDMLATLPNGKRIMDYYTQNPLLLYRKYMHRVAGEVALTEFGVPGARGVRYLRESVVLHTKPDEMATSQELEAFDRLTAQILGRPVPGEVVSQTATNFRLFASMARLGGAGITQFQEVWNALHHIGLRSTLGALGNLPKMIGEVGRLKKGQQVGGVLQDLSTLGGDVGMRDYYLVAPLDAPDQRDLTHGDDSGLIARLARAGSHIQQRVSFMQGIHAAQHRAMAEQIVLKAAKMLRDPKLLLETGTVNQSLKDMGLDHGLMTRLAGTVDRWAQFDAQGNLLRLDVTQMPDRQDAEAFMQAIHRGTRQIIQGTYVGETGAWAHNDWLKLLLQFRTFSVIAADKQFARTRFNHGTGTAAAYLLASMAAAIPLHLARVQIGAAGREDREEYIERQTSWQALVQASMNYTALSGLGGDAVEAMMVGYSGWSGNEVESVKGRGSSLIQQVPAAGLIEQGYRVAAGKGSVHDALNMLPGSRLPFMIPLVNLTRDDD